MLGLRGVRLLAVVPQIIDAQVRALGTGRHHASAEGATAPEMMVPLVADVAELTAARRADGGDVADVARAHDSRCTCPSAS